jgi:hypothetical protein
MSYNKKLLPETIAEIFFDENELHHWDHFDDEEGELYKMKWDNIIPNDFTRYLLITNSGVTTRYKITLNITESRIAKKQCDHNWVMDGHNVGDPICSKCYQRE